ncbi:MAG: hypothetical protein HYY24_22440 [Verrucomicrobia bacterium]|nr:hypothetical protein [Verrucomicrobiota bacterium]
MKTKARRPWTLLHFPLTRVNLPRCCSPRLTRNQPRTFTRTAGRGVPAALAFAFLLHGTHAPAQSLPAFDFNTPTSARGWEATHDISRLEQTAEGLRIDISGADPYTLGPARNYPGGVLLWLRLRLKSDQGGAAQVFYFRDGAREENSVRFHVPAGQWHEVQVPLPALGPGHRLRFDPPGNGGSCLLAKLWFDERVLFAPPAWPKPEAPILGARSLTIESGALKLLHGRGAFGAFEVHIAGQRFGVGHTRPLIGYVLGKELRWVALGAGAHESVTVRRKDKSLVVRARAVDPDGATWELQQRFSPASDGAIDVENRVTVDRERTAVYLPLFTVLPGLGSFGTNKTQALFAGLEYLDNEPSSSEADLIGPAAQRQVPDTLKLTFPLMAVAAEERYLGLIWEPEPNLSALFDSPDRVFGSTGHVMGILFPGSNGANREEGNLLPYSGEVLHAQQPLVLRATLIGGLGRSVVPAVQQYVQRRGLPSLPSPRPGAQDFFRLAARGWLDSKLREGDLYRHAAPGFGPQPAADAAFWMPWLSGRVGEPALSERLADSASRALTPMNPHDYNGAQVGHVRYPLPALIFGAVAENAAAAREHGRALLGRFQPDGSVLYPPPAQGLDYGKTHWTREANGLTAGVVVGLLEAATFSGDPALLRDGLDRLRQLDKFRHTVPRGAQTWEIPLHTPDILASAHLVRAYTLGYELTGDGALLEQATYWAWTGVPFVYLAPPTSQPVGLYSTIAVLGATQWKAPVWMGLPVQWCGLVYAEALRGLARHQSDGLWTQLADGIATSGVQQTYPASDTNYVGLLPDSFNLRAQTRNAANINPATLLAPAVRLFHESAIYDFHCFRQSGLLVHAPGELSDLVEGTDDVSFTVTPWSPRPSYVLVNGLSKAPSARFDGRTVEFGSPHEYHPAEGRLTLQIQQRTRVEILGTGP